jgi:hypothetical protein
MKIASTKTVRVLSTTYLLEKRPKERNIKRRNVCITQEEKNTVKLVDRVVLRVYDEGDNLVGEYNYTGLAFHSHLMERTKKTKNGHEIKFLTLGY